ncbi:MAG: hypothetical protein ACPG4I_01895 [Candidatus Puniceispirillaceae bacterium]
MFLERGLGTGFLSFPYYHYFSLQHVLVASAALGAGYSGRDIRVGVADSGVDGRHSEFSGQIHAGGDWQSAGAAGYFTYLLSCG